jgi:hypothetical protein
MVQKTASLHQSKPTKPVKTRCGIMISPLLVVLKCLFIAGTSCATADLNIQEHTS